MFFHTLRRQKSGSCVVHLLVCLTNGWLSSVAADGRSSWSPCNAADTNSWKEGEKWRWLKTDFRCAQLSAVPSPPADKMGRKIQCGLFKYRRDPNKSGGGTQSFSITPYSLYSSSKFLTCCGGIYFRWIQLAPPWRFLNFHLEHP